MPDVISCSRGGSGQGAAGHGARDVGPLKSSFLELPGEPPVKRTFCVRMFNDHLLAYDLDNISEARKLAILRSSFGAEGYRICIDLCTEDDVTYDTVIARLGNRFAPKVSVIHAHSVFHRLVQSSDENCVQFVTALRSL